MIVDAVDDVVELGLGIDAVELCGLDQFVDRRSVLDGDNPSWKCASKAGSMVAFDARAPLSGPAAIGQVLPLCRRS